MLTRLDQIDGVEGSFANEEGTEIELRLRPGADPGKVLGEAGSILSEEGEAGAPEEVGGAGGGSAGAAASGSAGGSASAAAGGATGAAPQPQQWGDKSHFAELAANERRTAQHQASGRFGVQLLGCAIVLFALLWWRHLRRRAARHSPQPRPCPRQQHLPAAPSG